jgi:hypothetical protein
MNKVFAAVIATAAVVAAGCGSTNPAQPTPTPAPTPTAKPEPIIGPARVTADDLTVSVHVTWSGCEEKPTLAAAENPTVVRLTLTVVDRSGPGIVCPQIARTGWASAVLHQPLGVRELQDARTGAVVDHTAPSGAAPIDP